MTKQDKNVKTQAQTIGSDEPTTTPASIALQAVLDLQARIEQQQQEVRRLQDLQTSHQERIAKAVELDEQINVMSRQLEDLLADIAAGKDRQAELAELRVQLQQKSDQLGDADYDHSDAVLAGMARKIEGEQASLKALQDRRPALVRAMLMQEAEAMGAEYAEAALKTISLYYRLHAVNHLLREQGQSVSICNQAHLTVPCFELESVRPHATFHMKDYIKRGNELLGASMHIHVAERQRIESLGVDLSPNGA